MQQSPIAKKLQSGSIFCFWFLGTASRGCHGWYDSGLAHAPSGKPGIKHDGEASDHTKRTTHWSNTRPALRIVPDAALRGTRPYRSNKPEARFWPLLLFLLKQKSRPKAASRQKHLLGLSVQLFVQTIIGIEPAFNGARIVAVFWINYQCVHLFFFKQRIKRIGKLDLSTSTWPNFCQQLHDS